MLSKAAGARSGAVARPALHLTETRASFERVPSLDGLRAVSILLVVLSHYVDSRLFPGGLGVLVFFVVSGFLITRLLFAEAKVTGRVSFGNFYLRRFFRLYPVVTVYAAVVIIFWAVSSRPTDWYEPASALFYFANYLYAWSSMAGHASATTMPFGILVPVRRRTFLSVLSASVSVRARKIIASLIAICTACLLLRIVLAWMHPEWLGSHVFYYTDVRLDSIAFGVLLAAICEERQAARIVAVLQRPGAVATALIAIFLCMAIRNDCFRETLRYTVLGGSVAAILAAVVFSPRYRFAQMILNLSLVRWIGLLSYSLYVWHTLIPALLHAAAPRLPTAMRIPALFALALAVAALSYYGLEKPAARLRHHFGSQTAG